MSESEFSTPLFEIGRDCGRGSHGFRRSCERTLVWPIGESASHDVTS